MLLAARVRLWHRSIVVAHVALVLRVPTPADRYEGYLILYIVKSSRQFQPADSSSAYLDSYNSSRLRLSSTGGVPFPAAAAAGGGGRGAPGMSSEASARNPELLAEEVPAKFVNEGVCVCPARLVGIWYLSPRRQTGVAPAVRFFFFFCHAMPCHAAC